MITTVTMNTSIDKAYFMDHEIQNGTVMRVSRCRNSAGGKGLNVARAVKLCGEKRCRLQVLQEDLMGNIWNLCWKKMRCNTSFCILPGRPDAASIFWMNAMVQQNIWNQVVRLLLRKKIDFCNVFGDYSKSNIITISGSIPRGMSKDIYAKMISKAKEMGKKVILDTSGELLKEGIKAKPTVVKPNQDEIELLYEVEIHTIEDVIKYARKIYEQGIPYVVISLGGEGALMVCEEGVFQGKPPKLEVVNTVG